jgi:predicted SprT family Zn-dependent metalloprotease
MNEPEIPTLNRRLRDEFDRLNAERFGGAIGGYRLWFSRTAVRTHGCINFRLRKIMVSLPLYEQHGWDAVVETLLHEMTHALIHQEGGQSRHSKRFWEELLRRGGTRGKYDVAPKAAYVYACPTCAREFNRLRRLRNPGRYSCVRCDRRYNPLHRLYLKRELAAPAKG